jgi:hypothetical protein
MNKAQHLPSKPLHAYRVLGPLLVVLFLMSGFGSDSTPSDGAKYYVGAYCWAGFGITLVATVVFTAILLGRSVLERRSSLN